MPRATSVARQGKKGLPRACRINGAHSVDERHIYMTSGTRDASIGSASVLSPQDGGALAAAGALTEPEAASALGVLHTLDEAGCCCGGGAPTAMPAGEARCSRSPSSRTHRSTCQARDEGIRATRATRGTRAMRGEDDGWTGDYICGAGRSAGLRLCAPTTCLSMHPSIDQSIDPPTSALKSSTLAWRAPLTAGSSLLSSAASPRTSCSTSALKSAAVCRLLPATRASSSTVAAGGAPLTTAKGLAAAVAAAPTRANGSVDWSSCRAPRAVAPADSSDGSGSRCAGCGARTTPACRAGASAGRNEAPATGSLDGWLIITCSASRHPQLEQ